jgi:hypothetical protein
MSQPNPRAISSVETPIGGAPSGFRMPGRVLQKFLISR